MRFRWCLAAALACGGAACKGDDKAKDGPKAVPTDASTSTEVLDDENAPSDEPTQVSGAFLVECQDVSAPVPGVEPAEGQVVQGCTVVDAETKEPIELQRDSLRVSITAGGEILQPETVLPADDSPFHFFLKLTAEQKAKLRVLVLGFLNKLGEAKEQFTDEEVFADDKNIGGKIVWEQFADVVNGLKLPEQETKPLPDDGKHHIFVTHKVHPASFGGIEAGDAICAAAGKEVNEELTWVAVLSASGSNARDRIEVKGPVYNLMAELVAADATDFWEKTADRGPVRYTEKGFNTAEPIIESLGIRVSVVWSGTNTKGQTDERGTCKDWTSTEFADETSTGLSEDDDPAWIMSKTGTSCSHWARLYCISK